MPYPRISGQASSSTVDIRTPAMQNLLPPQPAGMNVKRVTLTSKKNWWLGVYRISCYPLTGAHYRGLYSGDESGGRDAAGPCLVHIG